MAKTLMDSIAEDEAKLGVPQTLTDGDDNAKQPIEPEESDTPAGDKAEPESDAGTGDGRRRRGKRTARTPAGASQDESGASREDGEAPSRDSAGTRKDAGAPLEDAGVLSDKAPAPGDHAAWAKLRREKRELEAQLRTLKEKPAEAAKPADVKPAVDTKRVDDPEPNREQDQQKWLEWKIRQQDKLLAEQGKAVESLAGKSQKDEEQRKATKTYMDAIGEFNQIRDQYISKNPDYVPAFTHAYDAYARAAKIMNPQLSQQDIVQQIDRQLIMYAADCAAKGLNPAEELYDMAIERFGYKPNAEAEEPEEVDEKPETEKPAVKPKPNLKAISGNRKKSASPLMGPGQAGKGALTKQGAADMTLGEMMDLEPEDWRALEQMEA